MESALLLVKPKMDRKLSILMYHVMGACFKPYRDFFNLHTWVSLSYVSKPSGCSTYTIQESSLDIHLMYLPFHHCSQSKYRSYGSVSGYKCTIFFIIYSFFLGEATNHKYCFIFFYATIYNAWSCRSIWKLQQTSLLVLGQHPKHHSSLSIDTLQS